MINSDEINGEPVHASFEKQAFAAGQTRNLTFDLDPLRDLSYPDGQGRPQLEDGWYTLRVGSQKARFRYVGGASVRSAPTEPANGLLPTGGR